jgi:hypothetical protein
MRHNLCWYHEFPLRCYEVTLFTAFWCLLLYFSDIFRFINWCRTTWDALDEAVPHQTLRNPETCVVFTGVARMCCTKGGNVLFWQNVFAIRACNHVDWDPIQNYNLSNMQSINPDRRIRAPKPDRLDTHNLCSRLKLSRLLTVWSGKSVEVFRDSGCEAVVEWKNDENLKRNPPWRRTLPFWVCLNLPMGSSRITSAGEGEPWGMVSIGPLNHETVYIATTQLL